MLDLIEIKIFCAVVECGGLTAAADQLGFPKSTMSRRLAQLELRVGQPLLRRQSNRLQLTEAGRLFESYARQMLRLSQQGLQVMEDLREEVSGELLVRCHPVCAETWFVEALESFLEHYPGARISLKTDEQLSPNSAAQGEIWCWFGADPECGLRYEPLVQLPASLYASPDYLAGQQPIQHPRDVSTHDWIGGGATINDGVLLRHRQEGEYLCQPTPSRLLFDDVGMQISAMRRGQGIGILPDTRVRALNRAHPDSLIPCLPGWQAMPWQVGLLYPYGRQPRKVSALLAHIRSALPPSWRGCKLDKLPTRCEHGALYRERDLANEL
ncbi:LysR family transcriptional regulator [Aeromonas veronii]|uniref:LysR family transcriptional regulator n=1 Tax=Aeromonas veronii TaxID=654 RepID=UPI00244521A9|nr:LysR family transcriptional regulator [Aeromonas veronii]